MADDESAEAAVEAPRHRVRWTVLAVAALLVVTGAAFAVQAARKAERVCTAMRCWSTVRIEAPSLGADSTRDVDVRVCLDNGACGGGPMTAWAGGFSVVFPDQVTWPATVRITSLRIIDPSGTVLFDGQSNEAAAVRQHDINGEGCDPGCWVSDFAIVGTELVAKQ